MKRNNAKRVLALVLASAMLLQQGSVGIFAAETETVTEAQTEQMTEAKVEETQAPATEAPAPETKAEETQAPATEAPAEETKAEETQAPATEATEAPTEETKTEETQTPTTEAPTGETKIEETQAPATEAPGEGTETEETQASATEAPAETATEAPTEAVTEAPTEKETETESETEEAVVLDTVITQEVFQKTVEDTVQTMVKYTVKVANKAKTADAEDVSVKILLAKALSYSKEDGETAELGVYEKLEDAVNADVFKDIKLGEAVKDAYAEGGVVLWKDQKIAAGEKKEFVFFTAVEDGVADTEALRNLWFVNDEEITGNGKIEWLNTDLLKVEKELPIEFIYDDGNMVVTATLSDGAILPEGAQFVVTEKTLSEEEAALIEESLGDEQTMTGYVAYDMHFEVDGKEVEPENGTVSVSVSYEKAQALAPVNEGEKAVQEDSEVKMLHITDEQTVEDVTTDVDVKKNGKVREVGFTTDGFSTFVLMSSNEVMPIADDENVIFVEDVKIGTKEYSHLTKIEAYTIFNGLEKATASDVNYVVYVGETLNLSANVTEAGYELTVADNNEKISGNNAKSDSKGLLKASFKGVTPGFCKVELKNKKGEVIDTFRIEVKTPIYVDTLLGLRHKDMIHELLAPYVYNPETNPGMYLYNPKGEALYVKNTDSVENPNPAEGVWEGRNGRYVMSIGETITLLAPGSGTFSVDTTSCMHKGTESIDNNMAKATFTATEAGNVKITYGEEAFYVTVRSDDTNADHLDIEIADGGTYTVTVEETVYNEKGEPDGTRITETVYYAFVTGVNDCYVYSNTDKTTEIAHLKKGAYYRSKYDVTQSQFELTSAWKTDGNGNLVDEKGNLVDDSGKIKVEGRNIPRNQIKAVVFNLDFLLRPKKKTVTYMKNGSSYGTPEVETFEADDITNEFTVSGVSVDMNANDIREAANKCPDHTGLDFTLKADINEVVDLGIASVQPEVRKIFRSDLGTTLVAGQFTFDLYDKNPDTDKTAEVVDTATNDADGKVAFKRIVYTTEGEHTYYIKEQIPQEPESGIIYDTRVVEMKVKVEGTTINSKDGLKATYTYKYVGSESTFEYDPEFVNAEPNPRKTEKAPGDRHMVKVGDKITYEINWHNYKNQEATVVVTDKLDPGVTYDSSTPEGKYDDKNHSVTWTLEKQKSNATGTIELTVIVNEKAFSKWTYKDNADEGTDGEENENDFEVLNRASVQVDNDAKVFTDTMENPLPKKTEETPGDRKMVGVGDQITYRIYWKNGYDEPKTVTITDKLDPGVDFVSATDGGATSKEDDHLVVWTIPAAAAGNPRAEGFVELTVVVTDRAYECWKYNDDSDIPTQYGAANEKDYEVWNRAAVQVGDDPKVLTDIVENPVPEKKEPTPGDRVMVNVGDPITYEIGWKNGHKETAKVTVTDPLDPGVTYVSSKPEGKYDEETHTVTWSFDAEGEAKGTIELNVTVNENAFKDWKYGEADEPVIGKDEKVKDYEVWNRAKVQIDDDSQYTAIVENPVPEKTEPTPGDRVMVNVGDPITYEIGWKNGHKETAKVTVTDPLDPGVTYVSSEPEGKYDEETHTVTWSFDAEGEAKGTIKLNVTVNENAFKDWKYGEEDDPIINADEKVKDYEVWNRAKVEVGNDSVYTDIVENPVPEKTEPTPGDRLMVNVGDPITYEIGWKNGHKETAKVTVTDPLDPGVTYVSSEPEGKYDEETHTVTWSFDAEGEAKGTIELNVTVNENAFKDWKYGKEDDPIINADEKVKDYEVWNRAKVQIDDDSQYTVVVENPVPEKTEQTPGDRVMVNVGDPITYEIGWKNGHKETAKVTVTDPLDPGVTYVSSEPKGKYDEETHTVTWSFDAEGEAKGTIKLNVTVNENAFKDWKYGEEDDPIINADEKVKDYEVWNRAKVQVGNDSVYTDIVENPVPEKTEVTPGKGVMIEIGQDITYEIHWKNGHDEPATVTVTDKLDPGVTFKSADNGGTCKDGVVTWTLNAAAAGEAGSVKLTVTVNEKAYDTYTYGDSDTPAAGEGKDYEVLNRAAVQVGHDPKVLTNVIPNPVPEKTEVTPGKGVMVEIGQDITYEIHWKNGHDEPATVTVTDKLDPGVTFKSADNGGTCKDGVVTWTLDAAAAGEAGSEGVVKLTVTVNENAYDTWQYGSGDKPTAGDGKDYEVLNRAAVQVGHDPKVLTNVIPNPVPEKTEVTPGKGVMVGIGQDITYEIHWKNGHEEPATVTVTDKLDPGVTFKSADNGGTCKDGVVTWTLDAAAAGEAGSEGSVKLTVTVNENAYKTYTYGSGDTPTAGDGKDYEVLNRAGVQVGHDPKVLTNIIPNPVPEKEETDPGANETVYVGDQITYEIHWKNGHDTAADVTVTDPLDEGLDFVSADQGGSYDSATRTVTWVIKNVAAGQSGKVTLVTKVNVNARKDDYIVENQAGVQVGNDPKVLTQIIPNPTPEESRDGTIRVTKELTALGEELYAVDETFYVALFADEACTKRVTDIKALEFKNASSSTVTFKNIDIGRTYYVGEVSADGEVILAGLAEDGTIFTANFNEGKSAVVKNADGSTTVVFENTFEEIPNGFYRSGKLNITKKLLGVDGKAMDSDETFYAGIFADAEHTELSGDVSENIVELSLGGGSSVSASVDVVCDPEGPTTLYVTEVTEDGRPVGKSFGYTVTVDNGEVSLDVDHTSADVTITNQLKEEPESESEKPTKSVKTGDDTPLMGYVLLMLAALAMAIVAETMRRRRRIER